MNDNSQLPPKSYVFGTLYAGLQMKDQGAMKEVQRLWDTYGIDRINQYVNWTDDINPEDLISYKLKDVGCPRSIRALTFPVCQN